MADSIDRIAEAAALVLAKMLRDEHKREQIRSHDGFTIQIPVAPGMLGLGTETAEGVVISVWVGRRPDEAHNAGQQIGMLVATELRRPEARDGLAKRLPCQVGGYIGAESVGLEHVAPLLSFLMNIALAERPDPPKEHERN